MSDEYEPCSRIGLCELARRHWLRAEPGSQKKYDATAEQRAAEKAEAQWEMELLERRERRIRAMFELHLKREEQRGRQRKSGFCKGCGCPLPKNSESTMCNTCYGRLRRQATEEIKDDTDERIWS